MVVCTPELVVLIHHRSPDSTALFAWTLAAFI
jgi:hypothetical protein